jgi:hypothetical protein
MLCQQTRSAFPRIEFAQGVSTQPMITSHSIDGAMLRNVNGKTSATVTASLTLSTGFVDNHTFTLIKEGDDWKVCGNPY